jgi:hypothetical protein|tara:strand:- start:506 stop:901 length:396 start_codon:yes stop_codon:yes gene_type:complete
MYGSKVKKMYNNNLNTICLFLCILTYSQTDVYNIKNDLKFDSLLSFKKKIDKEIFENNFYSIQIFSGSFKFADSISKLGTEKYLNDSTYFYFETPNYKVRVGKYKSKINAEKKLREIKKVFRSAFIFKPKK